MSTQAVLEHHLSAFSVGVEEIMKDYTDESVLIHPNGAEKGLAGIRGFFQAFVTNFPSEAWAVFSIDQQIVEGEVAYIVWSAGPFIAMATDTFVVRDGKIMYQTFAAYSA